MLAQNNDNLTPEEFMTMLLKELAGIDEQETTKYVSEPVLKIQHIEDVIEVLETHLKEEEDKEIYPQKYFPKDYMPRIDELSSASIMASVKKESLIAVIDFLNFTADAL